MTKNVSSAWAHSVFLAIFGLFLGQKSDKIRILALETNFHKGNLYNKLFWKFGHSNKRNGEVLTQNIGENYLIYHSGYHGNAENQGIFSPFFGSFSDIFKRMTTKLSGQFDILISLIKITCKCKYSYLDNFLSQKTGQKQPKTQSGPRPKAHFWS